MKVALVTGAAGGLGQAFTRRLAADGWRVLAGTRTPQGAEELRTLFPGQCVEPFAMDVSDPGSIESAAGWLTRQTDAIHLVINNAAINRTKFGAPESVASLASLEWAPIRTMLETNALGPLFVVRAVLGLLRNAQPRAKVVNISSSKSALSQVASAGNHGYRMSKAALNMATRILAFDLEADAIPVIALHPGLVRTARSQGRGEIDPDEAVNSIMEVVRRLEPAQSGRFLDRYGQELAW